MNMQTQILDSLAGLRAPAAPVPTTEELDADGYEWTECIHGVAWDAACDACTIKGGGGAWLA